MKGENAGLPGALSRTRCRPASTSWSCWRAGISATTAAWWCGDWERVNKFIFFEQFKFLVYSCLKVESKKTGIGKELQTSLILL
jgi:hypothetical protein